MGSSKGPPCLVLEPGCDRAWLKEEKVWNQQESPAGATRASPVWTAPRSLLREELAGASKLLTAVALLSNQGTRVPNRSHCDSSSKSVLFPSTRCLRSPGRGCRKSTCQVVGDGLPWAADV